MKSIRMVTPHAAAGGFGFDGLDLLPVAVRQGGPLKVP
jgi:hypothetical protein